MSEWIPVSERLPKDGTYLVTVKRITSHPNVDIDSFAKDLYKVDEFDFYDKKGKCGWYNYDSEYGYWEDDRVIAWMPLPEPYELQESEEISERNMKMWEGIFKAEREDKE